jgi:hypothetical protein
MKNLTLLISICFFILSCRKDPLVKPSLETSIEELKPYYNFISTLKEKGYQFWSFQKYWNNKDNPLPDKLIVIRHDIHYNDIRDGYVVMHINRELIGSESATFYVFYQHPGEQKDVSKQNAYRRFIFFADSMGFDVQPHISINDFLIQEKYYPEYANYMLPYEIDSIFKRNYEYIETSSGKNIKLKGTDSLKLLKIHEEIINILSQYHWPLKNFNSISSITVVLPR